MMILEIFDKILNELQKKKKKKILTHSYKHMRFPLFWLTLNSFFSKLCENFFCQQ